MVAGVIGLGAGGHACVLIEALRSQGQVEIVGLLDPVAELHGTDVLGVPVLGGDDWIGSLVAEGIDGFFVGAGGAERTEVRQRVYKFGRDSGLAAVDAIHARAVLSASARWGGGVTVLAGAIVNARARLGENVLVNTGAIVEHDCCLGHHVHVAPGARLAGGVVVADGGFVGMGACVRQGVRVGAKALVGAGAVVVRDVPAGAVVVGVPARILRRKGARDA